jgi:hypothetical protein
MNSYDAPIDTERDVTSYLGYFDTDFGPNYIRNLGANDYTSGGTSFNGSGNDFPMMGTGNTVFFNWVTCSKKFFRKRSIKQDFNLIAIQYSDFEGLE